MIDHYPPMTRRSCAVRIVASGLVHFDSPAPHRASTWTCANTSTTHWFRLGHLLVALYCQLKSMGLSSQIFPSESDLLAHIGHSDYRDEDFPHHVFSSVVLTKSGAAGMQMPRISEVIRLLALSVFSLKITNGPTRSVPIRRMCQQHSKKWTCSR